jgi:hypothetical protein
VSGSGGGYMKPTAFYPSIAFGFKTICGIFLASALLLTPAHVFAQRGAAAAAHAGGARPGGGAARAPQAPAARAPSAGVSRPTVASPAITRPIMTRPSGSSPLTNLRTPLTPLHAPLASSAILFPSRPPRRFPNSPIVPISPFLFTAGLRGFGYNPFWFPGCNAFFGLGFGCGMLAPYYGYGVGIGYNIGYGPGVTYPSGPAYPPEPDYPPVDTSASFQYTPVLQSPSVGSLPEDLSASGGVGGLLRNEILLYLEDGSVFAVAGYTVSDGRLHYVTAYGEKNDIAVDLLDLQKTIQANASRGVAFTLTPPAPASGASAPSPLGPAPAPPGPINPPSLLLQNSKL